MMTEEEQWEYEQQRLAYLDAKAEYENNEMFGWLQSEADLHIEMIKKSTGLDVNVEAFYDMEDGLELTVEFKSKEDMQLFKITADTSSYKRFVVRS